MLIITAPAKSLTLTGEHVPVPASQPEFLAKTAELHTYLRTLDVPAIRKLMNVSEDIAVLNVERFQQWSKQHSSSNSRPAIFTFNGDVFKAMSISEYDQAQLEYCNKHLRILSGFYGFLRPFDYMQPYRLEMGTNMAGGPSKSLPAYWQESITSAFNQDLANHKHAFVLNLASKEYSDAIDKEKLEYPMVTVTFLQERPGGTKTYGMLAKRARGMMIDHCVRTSAKTTGDIAKFTIGGYKLIDQTEDNLTFLLQEK